MTEAEVFSILPLPISLGGYISDAENICGLFILMVPNETNSLSWNISGFKLNLSINHVGTLWGGSRWHLNLLDICWHFVLVSASYTRDMNTELTL